jgi:DNA-binding NarL/FixJ family response regulator
MRSKVQREHSANSPKIRLLIADDHPLIVEGVRRVLDAEFEVVGMVADGHALVESVQRLKPDLVLLDIVMPLLNGIEAARHIKRLVPSTRLIFITQHEDRSYIRAAFQAGASGYVLKQSAASELVTALSEVLAGRYFLSAALAKNVPEALFDPKRNPGDLFGRSLTPRQRQVLQLVAEGKSAKEIAGILKISHKTVEFHKGVIMDELGLRTIAELTRYAVANGIVTT